MPEGRVSSIRKSSVPPPWWEFRADSEFGFFEEGTFLLCPLNFRVSWNKRNKVCTKQECLLRQEKGAEKWPPGLQLLG